MEFPEHAVNCPKCGNCRWRILRVERKPMTDLIFQDVQCMVCESLFQYESKGSYSQKDDDQGEFGLGGDWWKGS